MFGRKPAKTQTQQMMDELAEGYGHFKQAAGHVAGGAAEKVTPRYDHARDAAARGWVSTKGAFGPMVDQMKTGAANARMEYDMPQKNRLPMLVGLLAAGAAVGAAGAMIARRRRAAAEWDEYEPMPADELPYDSKSTSMSSSSAQKVTSGAASVAESVSNQAGKLAESLHGKSAAKAPGPSSSGGPSSSPSSSPGPSSPGASSPGPSSPGTSSPGPSSSSTGASKSSGGGKASGATGSSSTSHQS